MRLAPLLFVLAAVTFAACDSGPGGSIYDPDRASGADPVISAIVTDDAIVLAGIDAITIQGTGFVPGQTFVYFEDGAGGVARGQILSASPTELRVQTPNFPGAALTVRVSVLGAENFSPAMAIELRSAIVAYGDIDDSEAEEVLGMTREASGALVASLQRNGDPQGIFRFVGDGGLMRERVAESARPWVGIAYGQSGSLYGVLSNRAVYEIGATGLGTVYSAAPSADNPPAFSVLTAGSGGVLWAAGADPQPATRIYRFATDGTFQASTPDASGAPFAGVVRALLVREGALYVASETGTTGRVWRFPIEASGALGAGSVAFEVPLGTPTALAFAADGTLFVGTSRRVNPIYEVDGSGMGTVLYPGVLSGPVRDFVWGSGTSLYYSTPVVPGATADNPSTPATLFSLETRRQGAP